MVWKVLYESFWNIISLGVLCREQTDGTLLLVIVTRMYIKHAVGWYHIYNIFVWKTVLWWQPITLYQNQLRRRFTFNTGSKLDLKMRNSMSGLSSSTIMGPYVCLSYPYCSVFVASLRCFKAHSMSTIASVIIKQK